MRGRASTIENEKTLQGWEAEEEIEVQIEVKMEIGGIRVGDNKGKGRCRVEMYVEE